MGTPIGSLRARPPGLLTHPGAGGGLTGSLNPTTGVFSFTTVPEPTRALLLLLGLMGVVVRRRRI